MSLGATPVLVVERELTASESSVVVAVAPCANVVAGQAEVDPGPIADGVRAVTAKQ